MKYFKVEAKCGHVRRNNYILKNFYIRAESKKEAARITKETPRVKHNHKDAIRSVEEITLEEYCQGRKAMSEDWYFQVHCKQDQALLCPDIYEFTLREDEEKQVRKKGNFRHVRYEALMKEKIKEMEGGYLYE